jgi:hypothetical protein
VVTSPSCDSTQIRPFCLSNIPSDRPKTAIREEVHCCHKKLIANLEQKKGAIAAFFQPVTIIFRELLDLRLREGERLERYAKTTKHFLKGTIASHFIDSNRAHSGHHAYEADGGRAMRVGRAQSSAGKPLDDYSWAPE